MTKIQTGVVFCVVFITMLYVLPENTAIVKIPDSMRAHPELLESGMAYELENEVWNECPKTAHCFPPGVLLPRSP
jgi:hypothetical protein